MDFGNSFVKFRKIFLRLFVVPQEQQCLHITSIQRSVVWHANAKRFTCN